MKSILLLEFDLDQPQFEFRTFLRLNSWTSLKIFFKDQNGNLPYWLIKTYGQPIFLHFFHQKNIFLSQIFIKSLHSTDQMAEDLDLEPIWNPSSLFRVREEVSRADPVGIPRGGRISPLSNAIFHLCNSINDRVSV